MSAVSDRDVVTLDSGLHRPEESRRSGNRTNFRRQSFFDRLPCRSGRACGWRQAQQENLSLG